MEKQQQNNQSWSASYSEQKAPTVNKQQKQQKCSTQVPHPPPTAMNISPQKIKSSVNQQQVYDKICKYLEQKKINFKIIEHQPTRTSQQSASIRNTPLEWGSKTMLVTGNESSLILLIYRANMKISWKKLRKMAMLGKKSQMAPEQQVIKLGIKPGGMPPLPNMIGLKGIMDCKFKNVQMMAFNAGHLCKSIVMKTQDFPLQDIIIGDITED